MELAAKVLEEQRKKPLKGDLHQQCVQDFIKLDLEESEVESMSKGAFKKVQNKHINQAALNYLLKIQEKQSKAKNLNNYTLTMQPYLKAESKLSSK